MNIKKHSPYLSLFIIVFYWIYEVLTIKTNAILPNSFSELAFRILIIKCIHLATIIVLLSIEQDWDSMGFTSKNYKKQIGMGLLMGLAMFFAPFLVLGQRFCKVFRPCWVLRQRLCSVFFTCKHVLAYNSFSYIRL